MNQFVQIVFYHFILSDLTLALKVEGNFFDAKSLQICFQAARDYVIKYHSAPTATQLKELLRASGRIEEIGESSVDVIYASQNSVNEYTHDWLYDNATSWAQWKNFIESLKSTLAYVKLNQDNVSVENVKEIMEHAKGIFNKNCIIEFNDNDDDGSDFWDAETHKQKKLVRSSTGYEFLDLCLKGGYFPGCLICFVGAPKIGKSLWLQNLAAASIKKGENNAYISLELPEEMITNRIGANLFSIPALDYEKYADDTTAMAERMRSFKKSSLIQPGQLVVKQFPTSTMSVLDLESWLLSKEEKLSTETKKFKFKNVFVDYINIMKNYRNPNSENTYMKIKQLAEDLKAIGIKHNWSIITATQTTRSQYDTNDMTASQVSESVGLGATVDAMFGIIADSLMKAQGRYYLKCLYDRVAPEDNKRKLFIHEQKYLRIYEDPNSGIEEVTMLPTSQPNSNPYYGNRQSRQQNNTQPAEKEAVIQEHPIVSKPILSDNLNDFGSYNSIADNFEKQEQPASKSAQSIFDVTSNLINITGEKLF